MPSPDVVVIESCNSTWLFDTERSRFRRVPRGTPLDSPAAAADWSPYFSLDLDLDNDAFVVSLNADGTRLLRSFRHHDPCPECGGLATGEVSLEAIKEQ